MRSKLVDDKLGFLFIRNDRRLVHSDFGEGTLEVLSLAQSRQGSLEPPRIRLHVAKEPALAGKD